MSDGVSAKAETMADPYFYGWRMVRKENADGSIDFDQQPLTSEDVLHPQEGDFITNHSTHVPALTNLGEALRRTSGHLQGVRIFRDVRIDWGVPGLGAHGPDLVLFVGARMEDHPVETYRPKEYGAKPLLVAEVTSPNTREHDLNTKVQHYYRAGVQFYFCCVYQARRS